jgi:hypothetical protein
MIRNHFLFFLTIFSLNGIAQETESELWNEERSASASCDKDDMPICKITISGVSVDVSQVTYSNLGKLGIYKLSEYERVVTFPTEWLQSNHEIHMVEFKTQAWRNGQRYTVSEPVLIKNGRYLVR